MPHNFSCFGTAAVYQGALRPAPASIPCLPQQQEIPDFTVDAGAEGRAAASSATSAVAPDSRVLASPASVWLRPYNAARCEDSGNFSPAGQLVVTTVDDVGHPPQEKPLLLRGFSRKTEGRRDSCQSRSTGSPRPECASSQLTSTPDGSARGRRSSGSTVVAAAWEQQPRFQHCKQLLLPTFKRRASATTAGAGERDAGEVSEQRNANADFADSANGSFSKNEFQEAGRGPAAAAVGSKDAAARDGVRSNGRKSWQSTVGSRGARPRHDGETGRKLMFSDERNVLEDAEEQSRGEDGQEAAGATARSAFVDEDDEGRGLPAFLLPRRRRSSTGGSVVIHERTRTQILVKPCIWIAPQFAIDTRVSAVATERAIAASKTLEEAERGVQLLEAPDASAASTSSEAYVRSLHYPEETARDVGGEVGASDSAGSAKHGICWSKARRHLGLVQRSPRVRDRQHKRNSPLRFYAKRLLCVFLYFVVADVFMCALSTTSDLVFQHHPQPKLPDRFHDWIVGGVPPPGLAQIVTDCLTVSLFLVTILRHLLFVQLPLNVVILLRFFFVMSTVYWLRGVAIFLTTIPSSVPNCKVRPVYSVKDFVENMLLASIFQLPQCTDMIISGHTLSTCLCVATWLFYNNCNKDQADLQRAPFYIFLRWVVKHRRKSLPQQQQQRCYNGAVADDESAGSQNQVQQHQQVSGQYCGGDGNPSAQAYSDRDPCAEPRVSEKPRDDDFSLGKGDDQGKHMKTLILPPVVSARQARNSCVRRYLDASSGYKADVASAQCYRQRASGVGDFALVDRADNGKEWQHEIEELTRLAETGAAGERGADLHGLEPEQCIHAPDTAPALLRSEAVVSATVVVTRTDAAAAAGNVLRPAAAASGGSAAPRMLRSTVSISGSVNASQEDIPYAVDSACPVSFVTGGDEGISPSAAGGICAAFAARALEEEGERKSSTQSQEMEDFSRVEMDSATGPAVEDQDISTDTESSREQAKLRIAAQGATELRSRIEDSSLFTHERVGEEEEEARRNVEASEAPKAYRFFHNPLTIGQERPLSSSVSVSAYEEIDLMRTQAAAGKRGETGGLVSLFAPASCFSATRDSGVVVADLSKASDDSRSVSQGTPGASSCSSSEEEDGRRALLAPYQSRRRHIEKEGSSPFKCCAMPPGLSSFFAVAQDLSSPSPMAEEEQKELPAGTFAYVDEASAGGREEEAAGYGVISKNQYSANQAQEREEELERMGQAGSGERRTAGGRGGSSGAERTAAGGRSKVGFLLSCRNCLSSIRRRLIALLLWGCSWNMLGTWCILQAAANIIVIDTSFCHYTVDIFFGIIFSFGCFTFYHMIVCLLWAARHQEIGTIADAEGADEAVTRFPATRYYRRRSSRCRGSVGSGEAFSARQFSTRGADGPAELRKPSSPRRRRASRATTGSRLEVPEAAGGTDLARRLDRESAQASAGRQKFYVLEGNHGHRGSKSRDTGRGGDPKDCRVDGEDSGVALRGVADEPPSSEGGSTAVALSIMREIRDTASCTVAESRNSQLLSGGEEELSVSGSAPDASEPSRLAANATGIAAVEASSASDGVSGELIVVNGGGEKGQLEYGNAREVFATSPQQQTEECAQREMPTAGERHFQTSSQHLQEPPEDALIINLKEARKPRLPLWNYRKRSVQEAEKEIETRVDAPTISLRADTLSHAAADAAPDDLSGRGMGAAGVSARPGGSREIQKKKRFFNRDIIAKGVKGRHHRVLQSIERAMAGEPNANAAADIATSILRFPLVRCAAYFIARLEGLELP